LSQNKLSESSRHLTTLIWVIVSYLELNFLRLLKDFY
jgi:hypothetical protein